MSSRRPVTVMFATAALLVGPSLAQTPRLAGPSYTLPAGEHRLDAFVDLLGQIRRQPIRCDSKVLEASTCTVHVARDLRLDAEAFEDVALTLLFHRGFLIVPGSEGDRLASLRQSAEFADQAVERTEPQLLARPGCIGYVTTTHSCAAEQAMLFANVLRPFFARGAQLSLKLAPQPEGLRLTGATDQVAFALQLSRLFEGQATVPSRQRTWPTELELQWPGGQMKAREFAARCAAALDANLLVDLDSGALDGEIDLGAPAMLLPSDWYERATQVWHAFGRVVVPLVPEHAVYQLCEIEGPNARPLVWRACFEPSERVGEAKTMVPVATVFTLQHADFGEAMMVLRANMANWRTLTMAALDGRRLVLSGLRDEVAGAVRDMQAADDKAQASKQKQ